jgi:hypothetical protein
MFAILSVNGVCTTAWGGGSLPSPLPARLAGSGYRSEAMRRYGSESAGKPAEY